MTAIEQKPARPALVNAVYNPNQPPQILGGSKGGAFDTQGGSVIPADLTTPAPGTTPSAIAATAATDATNPPLDAAGALDETRFVTGQVYPMPDGTSWQWNGRELVQMRPYVGAAFNQGGLDPIAAAITDPAGIQDPGQQAEFIQLNSQIAEDEAKLAAKEALADEQERNLRNEGVNPYEAARFTGKWREEAKSARTSLEMKRARQAEIAKTAPPTPPPLASGANTRTVGGSRWQFTVPGNVGSPPLVRAAYETTGPANESAGVAVEAEFDSAEGFRVFDLPLNAGGGVDRGALVPGSVYRIPESAGGGTGQWKSGMFYNFDRKADWNIRSAADLDAYSGASDQPTPEERWEQNVAWLKSGGAAMPAVFLEQPDIENFNSGNGEGVRAVQGDDAVSFSLGDGPVFLTLPDDAAAVVVRNWDDFKPRLTLMSRLFAEDLQPDEMRRLFEAEVYKGIPETERARPSAMAPDGTMYAFDDPYGGQRAIAELRMRAYDEMVEGILDGGTEEEAAALIGDLQQIMLPELMGAGRFLGELARDMTPGLNNVRSGFHFWNDLIEIEEEWKEGDITGLAGNSVMLLLDTLGMIPIVGSAFAPVRSALKKGARAVGKAAPRLDALVAQAQVWKHKLQWPNLKHKVDPSRIFGKAFDKLPETPGAGSGSRPIWQWVMRRMCICGVCCAGWTLGPSMKCSFSSLQSSVSR